MQARLTSPKNTRHQPPVKPMDVAFLVPEACVLSGSFAWFQNR
jgi:hypothetical protein